MTVPGERTHRELGLIRDQPWRTPMTPLTPAQVLLNRIIQEPTVWPWVPQDIRDAIDTELKQAKDMSSPMHPQRNAMPGRTFDFPTTLIERAVDGDSLEATVMWENPFYIGSTPMPILLRVAGVDCWDRTTPRGIAAMTRTAQLTEGKILHAATYGPYTYGVGTRHRLGEWVGDVYVPTPDSVTYGPSDTIALSVILLTERLALPYDGKGKRPTLNLPGTWPVA